MIPVMLLINCSSVILSKTNGYVGLNSIKFVFQYPNNYPYSEDSNGFRNNRNIFSSFQFQRNPLGALTSPSLWRYCIVIWRRYLKEFSPKPSTGMVSFCVALSISPAKTALLSSDWHHSQLSKGCGLTNSVMFCS